MKTSQAVTIVFKHYGQITIPQGTTLTNQTACGIDPNYHFVQDLRWIDTNYPEISSILKHDATYYGINIPREYVDFNS